MSGDADLRKLIDNTPRRPGVYCLLDDNGVILYVGKARRLRDRLMSYLRPEGAKTRALMERVTDVQVTITRSEGEALLLENNLIKAHRPRYNVLLRDDKSYPWVVVTTGQTFPRVGFYRGARKGNASYFGPYANSTAVRTTVRELQRLFRLRNCEDSYFTNRSRPCLQYQIDRCSAPCVGYISARDYAVDVRNAVDFLEGRSERVSVCPS
jgi:excinuclease ABC subunit C